jgi:hypothetical protein
MEDMHWVAPLIPIVAIVGAFAVAIVQAVQKGRIRELRIRERIAMIEKGLVPPPEVDPPGFDRAMRIYERYDHLRARGAGRHRRVGIILIGIGLGLMVLISSVGASDEGIGVGGFLCILGLAFLINSLFEIRQPSSPPPPNGPVSGPYAGGPGSVPPPSNPSSN